MHSGLFILSYSVSIFSSPHPKVVPVTFRTAPQSNTQTCTLSVFLGGCEAPPSLEDGDVRHTIKSQYSHNETVEYLCQAYYTMEGEPYRTCISGEWTGYMRCLSKLQLSSYLIFILRSAQRVSFGATKSYRRLVFSVKMCQQIKH